jgi:hypothetical protein
MGGRCLLEGWRNSEDPNREMPAKSSPPKKVVFAAN